MDRVYTPPSKRSALEMFDALPRYDRAERERKRQAIRAKNRQTIIDLIWLMIIIGLIIAGGRFQRGYWAPGPELALIIPGIFIIIERRAKWKL